MWSLTTGMHCAVNFKSTRHK